MLGEGGLGELVAIYNFTSRYLSMLHTGLITLLIVLFCFFNKRGLFLVVKNVKKKKKKKKEKM